jgi:undecaprenyl-diphosphatase
MDPVLGFLLGLIQGVAEWVPVSSKGMVGLAASWAGIKDWLPLAFFLHLGTLAAVVLRMRGDVKDILVGLPKVRTDRFVQFVVGATIVGLPIGFLGVVFLQDALDRFEVTGHAAMVLIGAFLIVTGLVLRAARDRGGARRVADTRPLDWVIMGLAQSIAVVPGLSRSGMTISSMLFRRLEPEEALRLSYVVSIPAIAGVVAYEAIAGNIGEFGWASVAAGVASSFVFGYVTLDALLRAAPRLRWDWFCVIFGMIAAAFGAVLLVW